MTGPEFTNREPHFIVTEPVETTTGTPKRARPMRTAASVPDWEGVARKLYRALDGIYIEEINGRLCALPESIPDAFEDDPSTPREYRCCPACRGHWDRTKEALAAYEELRPRNPYKPYA